MLTLYNLLDPSIRIFTLNQMENISGFVIMTSVWWECIVGFLVKKQMLLRSHFS